MQSAHVLDRATCPLQPSKAAMRAGQLHAGAARLLVAASSRPSWASMWRCPRWRRRRPSAEGGRGRAGQQSLCCALAAAGERGGCVGAEDGMLRTAGHCGVAGWHAFLAVMGHCSKAAAGYGVYIMPATLSLHPAANPSSALPMAPAFYRLRRTSALLRPRARPLMPSRQDCQGKSSCLQPPSPMASRLIAVWPPACAEPLSHRLAYLH
jgi:hypothetical protein